MAGRRGSRRDRGRGVSTLDPTPPRKRAHVGDEDGASSPSPHAHTHTDACTHTHTHAHSEGCDGGWQAAMDAHCSVYAMPSRLQDLPRKVCVVDLCPTTGRAGALLGMLNGEHLTFCGRVRLHCVLGAVRVFGKELKAGQIQDIRAPHCVGGLDVVALGGACGDHCTVDSDAGGVVVTVPPRAQLVGASDFPAQGSMTEVAIALVKSLQESAGCSEEEHLFQHSVVFLEELPLDTLDLVISQSCDRKMDFHCRPQRCPNAVLFGNIPHFDPILSSDPDNHCVRFPHALEHEIACVALRAASNSSKEQASLFVCGPRGVGKSTLARFLVNVLLNEHEEVLVLDCDVGQSEFTPPGILSLCSVRSPLLAPSFLSESSPVVQAFHFGDTSPQDRPLLYLYYIHALRETASSRFPSTPVIINTNGWVRGLGMEMLLGAAHLCQPAQIFHLCHAQQDKDIEVLPFTSSLYESVEGMCKLMPCLGTILSTCNKRSSWWTAPRRHSSAAAPTFSFGLPLRESQRPRLSAPLMRTFTMVSYFSPVLHQGRCFAEDTLLRNLPAQFRSKSLPSSQVGDLLLFARPWVIPFSSVTVSFPHAGTIDAEEAAQSLEGCIVALLCQSTGTPHLEVCEGAAVPSPSTGKNSAVVSQSAEEEERCLEHESSTLFHPLGEADGPTSAPSTLEWRGYGLVYHVDVERGVWLVLSPLSSLEGVCHLSRGKVEIPRILMDLSIETRMPFLCGDHLDAKESGGARVTGRRFLDRKKYQGEGGGRDP